jgi:hypothetical protein
MVSTFAEWRWFLKGLTFERDVPRDLGDEIVRGFLRSLAREKCAGHLSVAIAREWRRSHEIDALRGEGLHYHALLSVLDVRDPLTHDVIRKTWSGADARTGFVRVERFHPGGGAPFYLTKDMDGLRLGVVCPRVARCAHRRCVFGPSPW